MQGKQNPHENLNLFCSPLSEMLDAEHLLITLSKKLQWDWLENELKSYYAENGRPSVPVRVMVSLLLLKHLYNVSDERVVEQWTENPYWQYFSGYQYFQWKKPCAASDLVHFRHRIGDAGMEKIFELTVRLHAEATAKDTEGIADTTVQEKNITFPTDVKLYRKVAEKCLKIALKEKIKLKRNFRFVMKKRLLDLRMNRTKRTKAQKKTAAKAQRAIKGMATKIVSDLKAQLTATGRYEVYREQMDIFQQILAQQRHSKNKIYSVHEPHVKCIAKGKDSHPYEFGNKVGFLVGVQSGVILSVAVGSNEYDGKFVEPLVQKANENLGHELKSVGVDRGCKTKKKIGGTTILLPDGRPRKDKTAKERRYLRKMFRARAGIEPGIGHLKHNHRLGRNFLKGVQGDVANALLAAAAYNLKKFLNELFLSFFCVCFIRLFARFGAQKNAPIAA